jgi:lysozyme
VSTDPLVALLVRHEGLRRTPYRDTAGHLTIGAGHNLDAHPMPVGTAYPLSIAQCYALLGQDIADTEQELDKAFVWYAALDPVRQAAVTDLAFNVGVAGLQKFHQFLGYMAAGNWNAAGGDLLSTLYARELPARAQDLATMILKGQWLG